MKKKSVSDHWDDIFSSLNILEIIRTNGFFKISANQIRIHKEPRLMTKFDHSKNRPLIFKKNNLSILPIDNGEYIIGHFDLYQKLDDSTTIPKKMTLPDFFETIDIKNVYSESNALNVAEISGMITDIAKEDVKQTITGRMRANKFDFNVKSNGKDFPISVQKPQIEIDGGYESSEKVIVVEAKNLEPDDFIIRQLYYPYRYWKMKVEKEVIPVFLTYKNGIYTFYIYEFQDINSYNSIRLKEKISYTVTFNKPSHVSFSSIEIMNDSDNVQFPQADAFNRIIELIMILFKNSRSSLELTKIFDFTPRQTSYYISAAKYLGLVDNKYPYQLSEIGYSLANLSLIERNKMLVKLILSHKPFNEAFKDILDYGEMPPNDRLFQILSNETKIKATSTISRRTSTLKGWLTWVLNSGVEIVD